MVYGGVWSMECGALSLAQLGGGLLDLLDVSSHVEGSLREAV